MGLSDFPRPFIAGIPWSGSLCGPSRDGAFRSLSKRLGLLERFIAFTAQYRTYTSPCQPCGYQQRRMTRGCRGSLNLRH